MSIPVTVARAVHRVPLPTGIVVNVGAASPLYQTEVQRSLSASTSGALTVARLPGSALQFTDNLPYDGTARFYRSRAVQDGLKPGAYTPWSPALKPLPITSQVVNAPANSFSLSPIIGSPGPAQGSSFLLSNNTLGLLQQIANIDTTQNWVGATIITDQVVATTHSITGLFVGLEGLHASGTITTLVGQTISVTSDLNSQSVTNLTGLQVYLNTAGVTTAINGDFQVSVSGANTITAATVCKLYGQAVSAGTITSLTLLSLSKATAGGGTISGGFAINDTSGFPSALKVWDDGGMVFNVKHPTFGAKGDGTTDDTTALQAAFNAAGPGGIVFIPGGAVYVFSSTLTYPEGLSIWSGGSTKASKGTLKWTGAAAATGLAPAVTGQANEGLIIRNLEIDGNSLLNIGVDLHHVSHAHIQDSYIHDCSNGANACGVRIYRDKDAGYACYYNRISGGKISSCTVGLFVTGTGASSQNNCANSNRIEYTDLLSNGKSVYFERGNDLSVFAVASESPTTLHFQTAGSGFHLGCSRIENAAGTPTLAGLQLDSTANTTVEFGNYWATFTNDPVVDSSTAKDLQRLSTFGSGVNGGVAGVGQIVRAYIQEVFALPGTSLVSLNGGAVGGTGHVRTGRSTAADSDAIHEFYNGTSTRLSYVEAPNGGFQARQGRVTGATYAPTFPGAGGAVSIDASLGNMATVTVTDGTAFQINNPTNNPVAGGQYFTFEIFNNSGGAMGAITWQNGLYKLTGGGFTNPANGKRRFITFQYDNANWYEICRSQNDV